MTTEHTPTPWFAAFNVGPTAAMICQIDGDHVGQLLNRPHNDEFKANAAFIVRAVNAFDAMREALLDIRNSVGCPVGPTPTLEDIARIADNALALANGDAT